MSKQYRFKTVMVTDADRIDFTAIRDREDIKEFGRVTDKELFSAILAATDVDAVVETVRASKRNAQAAKEQEKLVKLQKELEAKIEAAKADEAPEVEAEETLEEAAS